MRLSLTVKSLVLRTDLIRILFTIVINACEKQRLSIYLRAQTIHGRKCESQKIERKNEFSIWFDLIVKAQQDLSTQTSKKKSSWTA